MVLGAKSGKLELEKHELATKLERQNGAKCRFFLKNRQTGRRERLEMVLISLLFNLDFR